RLHPGARSPASLSGCPTRTSRTGPFLAGILAPPQASVHPASAGPTPARRSPRSAAHDGGGQVATPAGSPAEVSPADAGAQPRPPPVSCLLAQPFGQFVHVAPQGQPGVAFVLGQAVERLRLTHGGEVGVGLPVQKLLPNRLLRCGIVLPRGAGV